MSNTHGYTETKLIRLRPDQRARLDQVAEMLDMTSSEVLRQGIERMAAEAAR